MFSSAVFPSWSLSFSRVSRPNPPGRPDCPIPSLKSMRRFASARRPRTPSPAWCDWRTVTSVITIMPTSSGQTLHNYPDRLPRNYLAQPRQWPELGAEAGGTGAFRRRCAQPPFPGNTCGSSPSRTGIHLLNRRAVSMAEWTQRNLFFRPIRAPDMNNTRALRFSFAAASESLCPSLSFGGSNRTISTVAAPFIRTTTARRGSFSISSRLRRTNPTTRDKSVRWQNLGYEPTVVELRDGTCVDDLSHFNRQSLRMLFRGWRRHLGRAAALAVLRHLHYADHRSPERRTPALPLEQYHTASGVPEERVHSAVPRCSQHRRGRRYVQQSRRHTRRHFRGRWQDVAGLSRTLPQCAPQNDRDYAETWGHRSQCPPAAVCRGG